MRKFFVLVAIVGLALLMAAPAMALDFKFGAEYRVRFYDYTNMTGNFSQTAPRSFTDGPGSSAHGIQSRIRPRFDVSDDNGNMTATLRLEIGDIEWGNGGGASGVDNSGSNGNQPGGAAQNNRVGNGAGGRIGDDGVNVETKWAYVDFASPFGLPLRWRAGLQAWYLPKGIIVDDDAAGVRAYGTYGIVSYEAAWFRTSGGVCTNVVPAGAAGACSTDNTLDNNLDYYQGKVDVNIAPWLQPGAYFVWGRNAAGGDGNTPAAKPSQQYFVGLTVLGDLKFLKYDLDAVWGQQKGGNTGQFGANAIIGPTTVEGWVVDGGVHVPIGPVLLHGVGSYATGDKQNGGKSEAMPWISPSWNGADGLYELIGSGGNYDVADTQDMPAGLWMAGFGAEYRPVKALWLRGMYGFVGFTRNSANCALNANGTASGSLCYGPLWTGKAFVANAANGQGNGGLAGAPWLGQEISFRADYDLWTNFKVQLAAGWLIPKKGPTAGEYILQLYYNF